MLSRYPVIDDGNYKIQIIRNPCEIDGETELNGQKRKNEFLPNLWLTERGIWIRTTFVIQVLNDVRLTSFGLWKAVDRTVEKNGDTSYNK